MILKVEEIQVSYARKRVLHGVTLSVAAEQVVALIGHNGAGKTTLLKAILGMLKVDGGRIVFQGKDVTNREPRYNVGEGIVYCPQGGQAFRRLTVTENLEVAGSALATGGGRTKDKVGQVFELFPALYSRRDYKAGVISGGERQMLGIGIALMLSPKLFLIDEPSGGLAPVYVDRVFASIKTINEELKTPVLLVEQNFKHALEVADRVCVMRNGHLEFEGDPASARKVMGEKFFGF